MNVEDIIRTTAQRIVYPETPDVEDAVLARIGTGRRPWMAFSLPRRPLRTQVAIALAVTLLLSSVVGVAVPGARSALLRIFHIGGIRLEQVDRLPAVKPRGPLKLGREVTLAQARHLIDFEITVPHLRPAPRVFVRRSFPPGPQVSFLIGSRTRPRLLLTEFRGGGTRTYADKLIGPGTTIELLRVNGGDGIWVEGKPHLFHYVQPGKGPNFEPLQLAGNTLIWEKNGITFRLEAHVDKTKALEIAASLQ